MRILTLLCILLLCIACFLPWMSLESKGILISGVDTKGTNFGKPAYFHLALMFFAIIFLIINKNWSHKIALFFIAFNLGWALRNFFMIPMCRGGECPDKLIGIYLMLIASILILIFTILIPVNKSNFRR